MTYTLTEIRNGTGWPRGARFALLTRDAEREITNLRAIISTFGDRNVITALAEYDRTGRLPPLCHDA